MENYNTINNMSKPLVNYAMTSDIEACKLPDDDPDFVIDTQFHDAVDDHIDERHDAGVVVVVVVVVKKSIDEHDIDCIDIV